MGLLDSAFILMVILILKDLVAPETGESVGRPK